MGYKGSKLYTFVNRIVKILDPKEYSDEVIKYDVDNRFPQNLIQQIAESGTATSCIEALNEYSYADGFVDESTAKFKVNEFQDANELLEDTLQQANLFAGVAWHIKRDGSGNILEAKVVDFESCRKTKNCIIYNPTLSSTFDKSKDVKYSLFKGHKPTNEQLAEIASFKNDEGKTLGEILYYHKRKPGQAIYPIPAYYANISDINADAEHSKMELENVNNTYLPSGILNVIGNVDDETEDDDGKTEWDHMNDTLEAFTGSVKDAQGETGRQKLAVFFSKTKEEAHIYTPISNEAQFNAIDKSSDRVARKVARAFRVPDFLINLGGSVGFASNIIADNITLFNNNVKKVQILATTPFKMCWPDLKLDVTQKNPIRHILPEVLAVLTEDELRALEGYEPKPKTDAVLPVNN